MSVVYFRKVPVRKKHPEATQNPTQPELCALIRCLNKRTLNERRKGEFQLLEVMETNMYICE